MLQVTRNIDVGKDPGVVDADLHDIGCIALQQAPGTDIALQRQQLYAVLTPEPDRMAAPAGMRRNRDGCAGRQRLAHSRDRFHGNKRHIGQPDQPAFGIEVCAHTASQAGRHTLSGIRTFDPVYRR